ncbi:hypothetical protein [Rhodococcus sp. NPDC004095]
MKIAAAVLTASAISLALVGCTSNNDNESTTTTPTGALDRASSAVESAASAAQGAITSAQSAAQGAISSAQSAAGSLVTRAQGAVDTVKAGTFTTTFKAAYPSLAEGRDDSAIEDIYAQTCAAIDAGVDEATVVSELEVRAGNNGTKATPEQAQRIYDIAKPLC